MTAVMGDDFWAGAEIISYTREQALADGVLVDVTHMANEAGFKIPVAITEAVWDIYITPPPQAEGLGQSVEGRLWDTLFMLFTEIRTGRARGSQTNFSLYYVLGDRGRHLVELKAVVGPGDEGEPVLTIMLPEED